MRREEWNSRRFGIYVHWPFCEARCPYCDFNAYVSSSINQTEWKGAYIRQLRHSAAELPNRKVSSVYFGGGTPSTMDPDTVSAVLREIADLWQMAPDAEITAEANPSSSEASKFERFRSAGVNRVSIGIQSLRDNDLKLLGRLHTASEARGAFKLAKNCFDRVSIDLIYGRQNQSLEKWESELAEALDWGTEHISLYQLTIESGTAFGERFNAGRLKGLPNEELAAAMYESAMNLCKNSGFIPYEVSNFSVPGAEGRHNLLYWRCEDYLGVGPGAHGRLTIDGRRFATETHLSPTEWLASISASGTGERKRDVLGPDEQAAEYLMMSLRLADGASIARYDSLGAADIDMHKVRDFENEGMITLNGDRLRISKRGRPVLDAIVVDLIPKVRKAHAFANES